MGTGGTAAANEAYNPDLPRPSYDCLTDLQTKDCVSISGTLDGQAIDRHCALPDAPGVLFRNPDAWPAGCVEGATSATGYFYQVTVPVQAPGTFDHVLAAGDDFIGADIALALDGRGGDVQASHFVGGEIAGTVETDPADSTGTIIVGTFRGTWDVPDQFCIAYKEQQCAPANVHGNFRVENYMTVP